MISRVVSAVVACTLLPCRLPASEGITSTPLNPREPLPAGATLFERLDPSRSGIDFINRGPPQRTNEQGRVIFFSSQSAKDTAGGICIGDADGDGLADIFLTRAQGGNRLYRNAGDFRFEDVTDQAGLADASMWSMGCTFVDIDDDGDLDLYVCGYDTPNRLFINDGSGFFTEQAAAFGLDFIGASVMMAFADYDLDGDLDAYLLTNVLDHKRDRENVKIRYSPIRGRVEVPPGKEEEVGGFMLPDGSIKTYFTGQADHLFRNDNGRFRDVTEASGIAGFEMGLSATWWDYNRDGRPDLYVANDFYGADHLYRNEEGGRFTDVIARAMPRTPWYSMGSDSADINNDGWPDYLATDMAGTTHYKSKMGMGDMEDEAWFLTYPSPRQTMWNAFYVNTGTGRFLEVAHLAGLAASDWTWAVKFGDLDNDGWMDLFLSNGMTRDLFNSDLKDAEREVMNRRDREQAALFWTNRSAKRDRNLAFRNRGDFRFEHVGSAWGLDHLGVSFGASLADLDNDGDLDLAVNNFEEPASVYRNRSPGDRRSIIVKLAGRSKNRQGLGATVRVETADGEQMRYLTLSRGYMSANDAALHFGVGTNEQIRRLTVEWPAGTSQVFEHLSADQRYIITESETNPETPPMGRRPLMYVRSTWLQGTYVEETPFDDFERQPLLPNKLSQLGPGMAWGDVNGDGLKDVYVGRPAGVPGTLYVRGLDGRFAVHPSAGFEMHKASEDMAALFIDTDGDGDLDLYVVSGGVECEPGAGVLRDRLYVNDGKGRFEPAEKGTLPDLRDSGSVVAAADFDRDGDLDLFVGGRSIPGRYPETPVSRLLVNQDGRFTEATDAVAPGLRTAGLVTSAIWSDADDDGWIDLLLTHEWGPVKLFRNRQGRLTDQTAQAGLNEWLGWWNGIAGADVDNDGDVDYLTSNFGLNTKYKSSMDSPTILYYGDLDGSGQPHLVEAEYRGEIQYPLRGFSDSRKAMPFLHAESQTFHNFASSTLQQLYTDQRLNQALRLEANTLESGLFVNETDRPGGPVRFRFQPFPRLAQIAPGFGIAATDADGDGNTDCYMVQNFYTPQPETGQMNGGVSILLQGNGKGRFDPVWPSRSGLIVPGDAKSLATTDLDGDGWMDFVVGVNNGDLLTFLNRAAIGSAQLRIQLEGAPGNPSAIGARVSLVFADGTRRTAEVYAGGGYLSQSSQHLVFASVDDPPATELLVRWPDGTTTGGPAPSGQGILIISR